MVTRPLEPVDVTVLRADEGHLWLSVSGRLGTVAAVPRGMPAWPDDLSGEAPPDWFGDTIGHALPLRAQGLAVGRALSDVIFGVPEVAALFGQTRGVAASEGAQVLMRLMAAPHDVSAWPWELLTDPTEPDKPLTLSRDTHVVRTARVRTYPVRQEPVEPPLHLLMVLSNPLREGPADTEAVFDLYQEKRALLGELRPLVERGLLRVVVEDRPTIERLRRRIGAERRGFHLLHYLGHAQPAGLKLENDEGRGRLVPSHEFSEFLQQLPDLRLAVFAGCETARAPESTVETVWPGQLSTADYCVRDAAPAVIGMQAVLPFGTERVFTRFFYQALTAGHSIAEALRLARWAIWDDDSTGHDLLDWAVPALAVGGTAGPMLDPTAKATRSPQPRRATLRAGVRQSDLRFFARQTELREAVDVLSGRDSARLLVVGGPAGVGKTRLLDRALEELDAGVTGLYVAAGYLERHADPLHELCRLVTEVFGLAGVRVRAKGRRTTAQWWAVLSEELVQTPFALILDDADALEASHPVVRALQELTQRRGAARVAVTRAKDRSLFEGSLSGEQWRAIALTPLGWPEIWQWIRRNLPVLTRLGSDRLLPYFSDLGPELERWDELARRLAQRSFDADDDDALTAVVRELSDAPTDREPAPPLFSDAAGVAPPPKPAPLTIAVAGPHTLGREREFARSITTMAARFDVSGRVVEQSTRDDSSSLARLLPTATPFARGGAGFEEIATWLTAATRGGLDVVVLDFAVLGDLPSALGDLIQQVAAAGTLVVAAGGNDAKPAYPAWLPDVLAVGALDDGTPTDYSRYFPDDRKPDLFAPQSLEGTPLAGWVEDPAHRGTSFSALYAAAAALLVRAAYRALSAREVREIMVTTADWGPEGHDTPVPRLDVDAALAHTRSQLLLDVLERGRMRAGELLAETGLPSEVALPLLDRMADEGKVVAHRGGTELQYENPQAIYRQYEQLRHDLPSGQDRTVQLELLVEHARRLARRGHFGQREVERLWATGEPGPRIVALAVMQERDETRDAAPAIEAIRNSRSAFEQFHALRLAYQMASELTPQARSELRSALETQMADGGHITPQSDRSNVARRILSKLDEHGDSEPS